MKTIRCRSIKLKMSSTRARFNYEPGEYVLCFEPDPTKSRVLYEAKVLDASSYRDKKGRRRSEFHIHFQGWNSSWDRIVPENFLLKDTMRNRDLMDQLANTAKYLRNNRSRNRKIRQTLFKHFKKRIHFESSSDEDEDYKEESYSSDDSDEGLEFNGSSSMMGDEDKENKDVNSSAENLQEPEDDKESQDSYDRNADVADQIVKNFIREEIKPISVEIPENLKQKLVEDNTNIQKKKMFVTLPANPCVIGILEGYVKNFAVNILCNSVEKLRPSYSRDNGSLLLEKNVDLCKEVVDGLRVMFDFTLPKLLLYNPERSQYDKLSTKITPLPQLIIKKEQPYSEDDEIDFPKSPRLRSVKKQQTSLEDEIHAKKQKRCSRGDKSLESENEEEVPRRVTRRSFAEDTTVKKHETKEERQEQERNERHERRCSHTEDSNVKKHERKEEKEKGDKHDHEKKRRPGSHSLSRRGSLRSQHRKPGRPRRKRHTSGASIASRETSSDKESEKSQTVIKKRTTADTNLVQESVSGESEMELQNVLNWKMIPDELYHQTPHPPSTVYGAQHLLRMFVKFPDIVGRMALPDRKMKSLLRHIDMFLGYLSERIDELFPNDAYSDQPYSKPNRES